MTPPYLLLALLGASALIASAGWWARKRLALRKDYRSHRDRFFQMAEKIIEARDAQIPVVLPLHYLGSTLNDMSVLLLLAALSLASKLGYRKHRSIEETVPGFTKLPQAVRSEFHEAFREAILAVSFRSLLFGPLIRSRVIKPDSCKDGLEGAVIQGVARHGRRHASPAIREAGALLEAAA